MKTGFMVLSIFMVLIMLIACGEEPALSPQVNTSEPTATAEPSPTDVQLPTETPLLQPTIAPTPTATSAATSAATSTPTPTRIPDPEPSPTLLPAVTPSPTATPTSTLIPTAVPAPVATAVPTPTATRAPAATATPTPTPIPIATATPAPTFSPTSTPVPTLVKPDEVSSTWRGIIIAPEERCSPYDSDDYRYSQSVEPKIVDAQGGIYGPYTGTWFNSIKETDIEHVVARSEAHDSGLCAASPGIRARFSSDLLNLTLAAPSVNRHQKSAHDVAEWLPDLNECWYVDRTVQVRREYGLTIDRAEAEAADRVLAGCESTQMVMLPPGTSTNPSTTATPTPAPDVDALALYDDNGNGRITCAEARAHGIAPVHRGHPAYEYMRDADGDGVVCE